MTWDNFWQYLKSWAFETVIPIETIDNLCDLTIKSDTGQHSRCLQCLIELFLRTFPHIPTINQILYKVCLVETFTIQHPVLKRVCTHFWLCITMCNVLYFIPAHLHIVKYVPIETHSGGNDCSYIYSILDATAVKTILAIVIARN